MAMRYCHKCGAPVEENARFCQKCGTPVARVYATPPPPPPPPTPPPAKAPAPKDRDVTLILAGLCIIVIIVAAIAIGAYVATHLTINVNQGDPSNYNHLRLPSQLGDAQAAVAGWATKIGAYLS
jgi:hypothetical protein